MNMRMNIGLQQVLAQKQILSPQMIQSMEILVLNSQQLDDRIERELEENVALEREEGPSDDAPGAVDETASVPDSGDPATSVAEGDDAAAEIDLLRDRYEHLAEFQAEERLYSPGTRGRPSDDTDDKLEALNNTAGRSASLQEHLLDQLRLKSNLLRLAFPVDLVTDSAEDLEPSAASAFDSDVADAADAFPPEKLELREERIRQIAAELIYNLDGQGRLLYPLEEIRQALNKAPTNRGSGLLEVATPLVLPVEERELEGALRVVQNLDPPGVGAIGQGIEGIKHCLLLQLDRDPGEYPLERRLIADHLEDISKNRLPAISKATGRTIDEIKDAIEIISSLNPLPGKEFEDEQNAYVRPDVLIEEVDGVYKVLVDEAAQPRVRISPYYRELLEESRKDPEIRKYIKSKIDNAEWLLHAIQQRKSTLQRVAEEVVAHQQDFFRNGVRGLKPLKMQEIADIIGVNVSTVSRAISGKYFQAPGCIKDLKFLFTGGTVRDDGSSESRDALILRIKDLIADEDPKRPYSDAKIVELLAKEGIHISRRTVTKYREAEGVPSSRERRQF
ncbi:MAG: RNA polymerase factor sigma-54 [Planctomycetes bacterium]|nr:RNA polymerase factor sigma-54 [Planctomycetota bacterium]